MIELNLQTSNKQEEIIKEYLENNVSEVLADKINNGVKIIKDNKTLTNKKTLSGFMKYAYEEARKLAEKGSNCACIEDKVVFGWAIHYFEEDTIEGNLYNEDGTEYKVEKPIPKSTPKVEVKPQPKQPEKQQATLFDFFDNPQTEKIEETTNNDVENLDCDDEKVEEREVTIEENQEINKTKIDFETGEVLDNEITIQNQTFDKFQLKTISMLLDGKVVLI